MKIVKYTQVTCTPCKVLEAMMKHNNLEADEAIVLDINKPETFEEAREFDVRSTPTLVLLDDNGVVIDKVAGVNQDLVKALFAKRG